MIHKRSQNQTAETEILSADDQKIARMLGNLRTVDAPKNFEFRLKAKIANSSVSHYKPNNLLPILRYAAPLSLVLLIGAMFVWKSSVGVEKKSPVAEISQHSASTQNSVETPQPAVTNIEKSAEIAEQTPAIVNSGMKKRPYIADVRAIQVKRIGNANSPTGGSRDLPLRSPQGGSIDIALKKSSPTIFPPGMDPNMSVNPEKSEGFDNTGKFTAREILSAMGIEADFGEDAWYVRSLKKRSLAERAGILAGDLMEAIDGRPIGANTVFTGSVGAKTVTVRREGKVLQLIL